MEGLALTSPWYRLVQWRTGVRTGGSEEMEAAPEAQPSFPMTCQDIYWLPLDSARLRCLRSFKSYSLVLLLNQKMESQEKGSFLCMGAWLGFIYRYWHSPSCPSSTMPIIVSKEFHLCLVSTCAGRSETVSSYRFCLLTVGTQFPEPTFQTEGLSWFNFFPSLWIKDRFLNNKNNTYSRPQDLFICSSPYTC